jgi:choline dehydrogenase-like flavoprotein
MQASREQLDLLIIGAGPAGLSAADTAAREGLNYLIIERGLIADTVFHYPVGRTVFSTPNELEMKEGALKPCREKPTREELLSHYVQFALEQDLRINTEEEAQAIELLEPEGFIVKTTRATYKAARVLFAIGAMAYPRRLDVTGEDLPKVHHRFIEAYPYVRKEALARPLPSGARTGRTATLPRTRSSTGYARRSNDSWSWAVSVWSSSKRSKRSLISMSASKPTKGRPSLYPTM